VLPVSTLTRGIERSAKEVHPLYRVVGISTVGSLNRKATPSTRKHPEHSISRGGHTRIKVVKTPIIDLPGANGDDDDPAYYRSTTDAEADLHDNLSDTSDSHVDGTTAAGVDDKDMDVANDEPMDMADDETNNGREHGR
jgi:hypothetical protein